VSTGGDAGFTPAVWIALASVALAALAWISTELRRWRQDGSAKDKADATITVQIEGFRAAMTEMVANYKDMSERQAQHEIDCAKFRGSVEEILKSNADTNAGIRRSLDNLSAQMSRLMPPADSFSQIVRGRGRGRRGDG